VKIVSTAWSRRPSQGDPMATNLIHRALAIAAACCAFTAGAQTFFKGSLLDRSFGTQGEIAIEVTGSSFYVYSMLTTRDGSLLVLYETSIDPRGGPRITLLARFRPDGSPDLSFGSAGRVDVGRPYSAVTELRTNVLFEDRQGNILLGGLLVNPSTTERWKLAVARLTRAGAIDTSFGIGGFAFWTPPADSSSSACNGDVSLVGFVERADGSVLPYGSRIKLSDFSSIEQQCMFVAQFTSDGRLDPAFGAGGIVESTIGGNAGMAAGRLLANGNFEAWGVGSTYVKLVLGIDGKTIFSSTAPRPGYNGGVSVQRGGTFLGLQYEGPQLFIFVERITIEARASDGTVMSTILDQGQVRADATASGYTIIAMTPDGGVMAKGNRPDLLYQPPFIYYRHHLCVWRSTGRLQVCEDVGPPTSLQNGTSYLAPDGSYYLAGNTSFALQETVRKGYIARFQVTAPQIEYYNTLLRHYFVTYDGDEAQIIDKGGAGQGWERTGQSFKSGGTSASCRFYGTPGIGPNSHFYTTDADECEKVKRDPGWTFEGTAFYATPQLNGQCASPLRPVHRLYNNRAAQNDSNHRYVIDLTLVGGLTAQGWVYEGVTFCVRP
jgi:uncharacterized delta-60 repeat protein